MVSDDPKRGALLIAVDAPIEVATPGQVMPGLRQTVTTLLADGPVYRQLDGKAVQHQTGITLEVIDEAAAGESVAPEIVDRLVNFLAAPRSA